MIRSARTALEVFAFLVLFCGTAFAQTPRLEWDAVADPGVVGYVVRYGTTPGNLSSTVNVGRDTHWVMTGLTPEVTYYFAVQSYDFYGQHSAPSSQLSFALPPHVLGPRTGLVWQHQTTGHLAAWTVEGNRQIGGSALSPGQVADTNWKIVATGDFSGDGERDLVWQHTDGTISAWVMRGNQLVDGRLFQPARVNDPDWRVVAAADMNRDGDTDLIWRNRRSGVLSVWYMDGTRQIDGVLMSPSTVSDMDWEVAGAGDFNRDGHQDLLWRHKERGWLSVWLMNGVTMVSGTSLTPNGVSDVNWSVQAVTDLTGDGYPDVIWRHTDGRISAWIMSALSLMRGIPFMPDSVSDANWKIVGGR